ncbi:MAG TPA: ComF family protein [Polyangiales bacterium]
MGGDTTVMYRALLHGLLELLAPPTCAACADGIEARELTFCSACELLVDRVPVRVGDDRDACVFGGPLRDAIHRLKYRGQSELAPGLAHWLIEAAQPLAQEVDLVTAVPLHARRLRERGFNQSVLLARPVARALAVPLVPRWLKRVRGASAQVGSGRQARVRALAGAFTASAAAKGRRVLVVDDVRTTGATLEEARRALHTAGATAVYTLALAVADPELDA